MFLELRISKQGFCSSVSVKLRLQVQCLKSKVWLGISSNILKSRICFLRVWAKDCKQKHYRWGRNHYILNSGELLKCM